MTTLTSAPLAPLLKRLFDDAERARPSTHPALANLSAEERARLMRSKTEYLDFYTLYKDLPLAISPETGRLLYMLARRAFRRMPLNAVHWSKFRGTHGKRWR